MLDINHAVQYYLFMKWFKINHPALFSKYRLHIVVPIESFKIAATMENVDPSDKKTLQAAIEEYFRNAAD